MDDANYSEFNQNFGASPSTPIEAVALEEAITYSPEVSDAGWWTCGYGENDDGYEYGTGGSLQDCLDAVENDIDASDDTFYLLGIDPVDRVRQQCLSLGKAKGNGWAIWFEGESE